MLAFASTCFNALFGCCARSTGSADQVDADIPEAEDDLSQRYASSQPAPVNPPLSELAILVHNALGMERADDTAFRDRLSINFEVLLMNLRNMIAVFTLVELIYFFITKSTLAPSNPAIFGTLIAVEALFTLVVFVPSGPYNLRSVLAARAASGNILPFDFDSALARHQYLKPGKIAKFIHGLFGTLSALAQGALTLSGSTWLLPAYSPGLIALSVLIFLGYWRSSVIRAERAFTSSGWSTPWTLLLYLSSLAACLIYLYSTGSLVSHFAFGATPPFSPLLGFFINCLIGFPFNISQWGLMNYELSHVAPWFSKLSAKEKSVLCQRTFIAFVITCGLPATLGLASFIRNGLPWALAATVCAASFISLVARARPFVTVKVPVRFSEFLRDVLYPEASGTLTYQQKALKSLLEQYEAALISINLAELNKISSNLEVQLNQFLSNAYIKMVRAYGLDSDLERSYLEAVLFDRDNRFTGVMNLLFRTSALTAQQRLDLIKGIIGLSPFVMPLLAPPRVEAMPPADAPRVRTSHEAQTEVPADAVPVEAQIEMTEIRRPQAAEAIKPDATEPQVAVEILAEVKKTPNVPAPQEEAPRVVSEFKQEVSAPQWGVLEQQLPQGKAFADAVAVPISDTQAPGSPSTTSPTVKDGPTSMPTFGSLSSPLSSFSAPWINRPVPTLAEVPFSPITAPTKHPQPPRTPMDTVEEGSASSTSEQSSRHGSPTAFLLQTTTSPHAGAGRVPDHSESDRMLRPKKIDTSKINGDLTIPLLSPSERTERNY